jgi:hypothetical protein
MRKCESEKESEKGTQVFWLVRLQAVAALVRHGKGASLPLREVRRLHSFWPRIPLGRPEPFQVRQIIRKSDQALVQIGSVFGSEGDDVEPQQAELGVLRIVQTKDADKSPTCWRVSLDGSVVEHADVFSQEGPAGIGNALASFGCVAGCATVDQVVVLGDLLRIDGHREEVIDGKRAAYQPPLLPQKAVDAPESELIPEPGAITGVIGITSRPMPAAVGSGRVDERRIHAPGSGLACA